MSQTLNKASLQALTLDEDCTTPPGAQPIDERYLCSVEEAARIVGQKWTLQIVNVLMDFGECRFCVLQDALGGVNPSTLSARLKKLEEEGIVAREQLSAMPPHVVYRLTDMGSHLSGVIRELTSWSRTWLCAVPEELPAN